MKTTITVFTLALALLISGCGGAANNSAPINTNTARNAPAAPTVETFFALDKQAQEAYTKGDSQFFQTFLSDKFAMQGSKGEHYGKSETVKMIGTVKCDVKKMDFSEPQMAKIDNDTYVISYKSTWDGTCTEDGKSMKIPSPVRSASLYVRNGDKWMGAWHGETPIMDAAGAPAADKAPDAKSAEPKKEDAKKPGDNEPLGGAGPAKKKADGSPVDPKSAGPGDTAAAKPAKEADPSGAVDTVNTVKSPNTDALAKLHTAGWEAYKERSAEKLGAMTSANLSFVDPMGKWVSGKAEVIKEWTAAKCDIKSTNVADSFATSLSPTVELLFAKGTASGTCEGPDGKPMKLGSLWNTAVYVKEGNDWKLAFLFESPA